jgi:hypothetical protein
MITCVCGYRLTGELQKGRVYYRCQSTKCPVTSVREDRASAAIHGKLIPLILEDHELVELRDMAIAYVAEDGTSQLERARAINLQIDNITHRLSRLTDGYLDGTIDKDAYLEKKSSLLIERKGLEEERQRTGGSAFSDLLMRYLEHLILLKRSYETGTPEEKRDLVKNITSNFSITENNLAIELKSPFREIANLISVQSGPPSRSRPRTSTAESIFQALVTHCEAQIEDRQHEDGMILDAA